MRSPDVLGATLTLGFGTTVAMWAVGYVGRLPFVMAPAWLLISLFVLCLLGGGWLAGRLTGRGLGLGSLVGGLSALLSLLVLGSLLSESDSSKQLLISVASVVVLCAVLAALGAAVGARGGSPADPSWTGHMGFVAGAATFILIVAGGLVTSHEAGLAVNDWPRTYGWSMFLYPLRLMTGGVYYEHTHRLTGALVGLTTIAFFAHMQLREERTWLKRFGLGLVALVVFQGILGGLRVTGRLTLSADTADLKPSIELAVVHGVLAQVFFSLLLAAAAACTATWKSSTPPLAHSQAESDRSLMNWLVGLVFFQLVLGALVRHMGLDPIWHIALAVAVVLVAVATGVRAWGIYGDLRPLPKLGLALASLVGLQILLGVAALAVTMTEQENLAISAPLATAHQTVGATILVLAVQLRAWHGRLVTPEVKG